MIRYLTSDFGNYEKKDGQKITHPIDNINGIVDQFKNDIKKFNKVVFVASNMNNPTEKVMEYANIFFDSLKMVGIEFADYLVLDGSKINEADKYIDGADLIFLCGGDTYNQHVFFEAMNLKSLLENYQGVLVGQSAGALNMPLNVFNSPEEMEESEPVFFDGLGLVDINIEPHFEYDISNFDAAKKYQREAIIKESFNRPIYGQVNKSHIRIDEDNKAVIYGETYLIENGNIVKICDNKNNVAINRNSKTL
jgi:dipeptidase E